MRQNLTLDQSSRTIVSRMEHVHLAVADLARSIEWYEEVFGFEVRWTDGRTAHIGTDRFYVAVTAHRGLPPSEGDRTGTARIAHFAFTTPNLETFGERLPPALNRRTMPAVTRAMPSTSTTLTATTSRSSGTWTAMSTPERRRLGQTSARTSARDVSPQRGVVKPSQP